MRWRRGGRSRQRIHLAQRCARVIVDEFAYYNREFRAISRRAPERFENLDWAGTQRDVVERLDLYTECVNRAVDDLTRRLGERVHAVTNPTGRFYTYSSGEISRFFIKPNRKGYKRSGSKCITVTCDYGGGSSGGPIFNDQGQVVAVVSEAAVVPDKKIVHYDSIPYESILGLFNNEQ